MHPLLTVQSCIITDRQNKNMILPFIKGVRPITYLMFLFLVFCFVLNLMKSNFFSFNFSPFSLSDGQTLEHDLATGRLRIIYQCFISGCLGLSCSSPGAGDDWGGRPRHMEQVCLIAPLVMEINHISITWCRLDGSLMWNCITCMTVCDDSKVYLFIFHNKNCWPVASVIDLNQMPSVFSQTWKAARSSTVNPQWNRAIGQCPLCYSTVWKNHRKYSEQHASREWWEHYWTVELQQLVH